MTSSGKKGKKMTGKTFHLEDFMGGDAATVTSGSSWAEMMEDATDVNATLQKRTEIIQARQALPSAPRLARGDVEVDMNLVPTQPPFEAFMTNISWDSTEANLYDFFEHHQVAVDSVRLVPSRDGRSGHQGRANASFATRDSLVQALKLSNQKIGVREVFIMVQQQPRQSQSQGYNRPAQGQGNARDQQYSSFGSRQHQAHDNNMQDKEIVTTTSDRRGPPQHHQQYDTGHRQSNYGQTQAYGYDQAGPQQQPNPYGSLQRRQNNYSGGGGGYQQTYQNSSMAPHYQQDQQGYDQAGGRPYQHQHQYAPPHQQYNRGGGGYDQSYYDNGSHTMPRGGYGGGQGQDRVAYSRPAQPAYVAHLARQSEERMRDHQPEHEPAAAHQPSAEKEVPAERPRLRLVPRSTPASVDDENAAARKSSAPKNDPFGGAKPVDTLAKELEIINKQLQEKEGAVLSVADGVAGAVPGRRTSERTNSYSSNASVPLRSPKPSTGGTDKPRLAPHVPEPHHPTQILRRPDQPEHAQANAYSNRPPNTNPRRNDILAQARQQGQGLAQGGPHQGTGPRQHNQRVFTRGGGGNRGGRGQAGHDGQYNEGGSNQRQRYNEHNNMGRGGNKHTRQQAVPRRQPPRMQSKPKQLSDKEFEEWGTEPHDTQEQECAIVHSSSEKSVSQPHPASKIQPAVVESASTGFVSSNRFGNLSVEDEDNTD